MNNRWTGSSQGAEHFKITRWWLLVGMCFLVCFGGFLGSTTSLGPTLSLPPTPAAGCTDAMAGSRQKHNPGEVHMLICCSLLCRKLCPEQNASMTNWTVPNNWTVHEWQGWSVAVSWCCTVKSRELQYVTMSKSSPVYHHSAHLYWFPGHIEKITFRLSSAQRFEICLQGRLTPPMVWGSLTPRRTTELDDEVFSS